jgi:hypothetical protein
MRQFVFCLEPDKTGTGSRELEKSLHINDRQGCLSRFCLEPLDYLGAAVSEVFAAAVSFEVEGDSARSAKSDAELAAGGIAGRCVF